MIRRRVLIVEDDPMTRGLLTSMLEGAGYEVKAVGDASDARDAVGVFDPDALVLDVDLGIGPTGFDVADVLMRGRAHLAVLFLTHLPDARFAGRSIDSLPKRAAYLHKERLATPGLLAEVLDKTLRGEGDVVRDDLDPEHRFDRLSATQLEVMRLVAAGMSNQQIANRRNTSVRAVTDVISRCFEALGIDDGKEGNARVLAVREYMRIAGVSQDSM
jgi:DNA-binding NarL/FixJ family response regulator